MSDKDMNKREETDWERIDAMSDEMIDTSDIPPLTESFFERATLRKPKYPISVTLKLDPEVLAWFKTQGDEYEQRINAALRIYVEAHKSYSNPT